MSLCALCATPIDGDPECMVLVCKNGHDDSVHDKCYKNRSPVNRAQVHTFRGLAPPRRGHETWNYIGSAT